MKKRKLATLIRGAVCLLVLSGPFELSAQPDRSFECLHDSFLPAAMGASVLTATPSGPATDAYADYYGHVTHYIPENLMHHALYVHKTVRVALHVIQPNYPADYNYKVSDEAQIRAFMSKANLYLSQNDRPTDPMYVGGRDP